VGQAINLALLIGILLLFALFLLLVGLAVGRRRQARAAA